MLVQMGSFELKVRRSAAMSGGNGKTGGLMLAPHDPAALVTAHGHAHCSAEMCPCT